MFSLPTFLKRARPVGVAVDQTAPSIAVAEKTERRQSPRRGGPPVEVMLDDGLAAKPVAGWVRNRSAGGLGISCAQTFPEGIQLQVRVTVAPPSTPWTPVTVRACTPFLTGHMLHCEFVGEPSEEARLLFR